MYKYLKCNKDFFLTTSTQEVKKKKEKKKNRTQMMDEEQMKACLNCPFPKCVRNPIKCKIMKEIAEKYKVGKNGLPHS